MRSNRIRLFSFSLMLMMMAPLASVALAGLNAQGISPTMGSQSDRYSGYPVIPGHHQAFKKTGSYPPGHVNFYRYRSFGTQHDGYRFRPLGPNSQMPTTFNRHAYAPRNARYQWRPTYQPNNRVQTSGWAAPQPPVWYRADAYRFIPRTAMDSRNQWPGYAYPRPPLYGERLKFRPFPEARPRYVAKWIYKPGNIAIPEHYVYRPLRPKMRQQQIQKPENRVTERFESRPDLRSPVRRSANSGYMDPVNHSSVKTAGARSLSQSQASSRLPWHQPQNSIERYRSPMRSGRSKLERPRAVSYTRAIPHIWPGLVSRSGYPAGVYWQPRLADTIPTMAPPEMMTDYWSPYIGYSPRLRHATIHGADWQNEDHGEADNDGVRYGAADRNDWPALVWQQQ